MVTKQLEILSLEMKNSCTDFAKTVDTYCNDRYSCTSIVHKRETHRGIPILNRGEIPQNNQKKGNVTSVFCNNQKIG